MSQASLLQRDEDMKRRIRGGKASMSVIETVQEEFIDNHEQS